MNQKELYLLSATIFLTVVAWVLFELYSIHRVTPTDSQIEAVSLNYQIDTNIFEILRNKIP